MGYDVLKQPSKPSVQLRPAKQVLSGLRHDPKYDFEDYVIGYIDRNAGILEKPVSEWDKFCPDDHVAYFKHVSSDDVVWDRLRKIDKLV
jgi:hypothetical protein